MSEKTHILPRIRSGIPISVKVKHRRPHVDHAPIKGQVTIPKQIRDAVGLKPGMPLDFAVNHEGEAVIHGAKGSAKRKSDRFEVARGNTDVKWRTKDLMAVLRSDA